MIQSHNSKNARQALTDQILAIKGEKDLSFAQLTEGTGLSVTFVTAALLGQHPLPTEAAAVVADKLGLGEEAVAVLQTIPMRGSLEEAVPTDPTILCANPWLEYGR